MGKIWQAAEQAALATMDFGGDFLGIWGVLKMANLQNGYGDFPNDLMIIYQIWNIYKDGI